ncbi:cupin domain-containing protein [Paraphaeosphaeria minitans]|uniref:Cupin domain-containing protein n=1 Tax=Paraphaeosphaeria minitans TaxID=565426 RepID=A0A9P6GAG9_9PLEO|nr:cupin domain-containing protein [Paraphaeosphaeria minitans]
MAPPKKRETRENQFYDVGVQGRKTGITLKDRGVRDEHGLEPISGIFSSPEKSPPKRASNQTGGTLTESESMDLTSPIAQPAASAAKLLRSARTHLPPPKARSPMKTSLGSSPRRQSSMGPRAQPEPVSSPPSRSPSHPVISRRLDFEQEEFSLQETPALSGSGQRRGTRRSIYSIEPSPSRITNSTMEETIQEEIYAAEESAILNDIGEESGLQDIGNDTVLSAESEISEEDDEAHEDMTAEAEIEVSVDMEESEIIPEPVKQPGRRGRKRKSDAVEPATIEKEVPEPKKRGRKPLEKKDKNVVTAPAATSRRSKRFSDVTEQETSTMEDDSAGAAEAVDTPPEAPRRRGRPPAATAAPAEMAPPAKKQKHQAKEPEKKNVQSVSKKPKAAPVPKKKAKSEGAETASEQESAESGKLVDVYGKPISKADLEQMSTTSAGTRFGRGRHLSVFRELEPDSAATVGRTGRHRVKPINFWANEAVSYDPTGNMQAVVNRVYQEPPKVKRKAGRKGQKRSLSAIEEEDDDDEVGRQPWEVEGGGKFQGTYKGYDAANKISTNNLIESTIAWSDEGIKPSPLPDGSFKFIKLASGHVNDEDPSNNKTYMSWGFLELEENQMKRAKNSSAMHMVFHVASGAVEIRVHENILTVRRGGVFQVPRGKSILLAPLEPASAHHVPRDGDARQLPLPHTRAPLHSPPCATVVNLCLIPVFWPTWTTGTCIDEFASSRNVARCCATCRPACSPTVLRRWRRPHTPTPACSLFAFLPDLVSRIRCSLPFLYPPHLPLTDAFLAGNMYSIRNVGTNTSRLFYAQGCETRVLAED